MKIIKHGFVSPKAKNHFRYNAWPTVITLHDGTLLAAWSGERMKHVCPFGKVMAARSVDGGYTWLPPYCIQDLTIDDRDAGLLHTGNRVLMTSFTNDRKLQREYMERKNHIPSTPERKAFISAYLDMITDEDERMCGPTLAVSMDNGYTFSDPVLMPLSSPHGPTLLRDGSILMVGRNYDFDRGDFVNKISAVLLDAEGHTLCEPWTVAEAPREGVIWCEPHAAEMPNGDILVAIRCDDKPANMRTLYLCRSTDGGRTFSTPQPTGWDGYPAHIFVHSSGAVVLTYSRRLAPEGIRARVSRDNGYTFGEEIVLRDDGLDWDLGYPSTAENGKGQLVTVYYMKEQEGTDENRIQFTLWEL